MRQTKTVGILRSHNATKTAACENSLDERCAQAYITQRQGTSVCLGPLPLERDALKVTSSIKTSKSTSSGKSLGFWVVFTGARRNSLGWPLRKSV